MSSNVLQPLCSTSPVPVRRCVSLAGWCYFQMIPPGLTFSSSVTLTKVFLTVFAFFAFFLRLHTEICAFAGDVYKFQTGSRFSAIIWHKKLEEACRGSRPKVRARPSFLVLLMAPSWVLMVPNAPIEHSIGTCS